MTAKVYKFPRTKRPPLAFGATATIGMVSLVLPYRDGEQAELCIGTDQRNEFMLLMERMFDEAERLQEESEK